MSRVNLNLILWMAENVHTHLIPESANKSNNYCIIQFSRNHEL